MSGELAEVFEYRGSGDAHPLQLLAANQGQDNQEGPESRPWRGRKQPETRPASGGSERQESDFIGGTTSISHRG